MYLEIVKCSFPLALPRTTPSTEKIVVMIKIQDFNKE